MKMLENETELIRSGIKPPFKITPHWESLLNGRLDDPLRIQVVPSLQEKLRDKAERDDPLGELSHSPLPRLIRRYRDRALVVATGRCALYCRHCFRRRISGDSDISRDQIQNIAQWLGANRDVMELIISGGDPLMLPHKALLYLMDECRRFRPDIVLRLATRIPIVDPARISRRFIAALGRRRPLWMLIQTNHPRELSAASLRFFGQIQRCGIPMLNQSVLLKGVNDDVNILEKLCRDLVAAGVKPLYLFQGDLAEGTAHFRLPLEEARQLVDNLRSRLGGLAMPNFAVDLPDGGGKVPLAPNHILSDDEHGWLLRTPDGVEGYYPKEG